MNGRSLSLVLMALAGCGSGNTPLTPTQFCDDYAQEVCNAVSPACLIPVANCTSSQVAQCTANAVNSVAASQNFIASNADACLSKVKEIYGKLKQGAVALQAADVQAMDTVCSRVYRGTGTANEACTTDADCIDNLVCDKLFCGTPTQVAAGGGCANIGEYCVQGFYCGPAGGVLMCVAKAGLGGACDGTPCVESLRCAGGVCAAQLGIGVDCAVDQDCTSRLCEPYAHKCAEDIRFANGSAACIAISST